MRYGTGDFGASAVERWAVGKYGKKERYLFVFSSPYGVTVVDAVTTDVISEVSVPIVVTDTVEVNVRFKFDVRLGVIFAPKVGVTNAGINVVGVIDGITEGATVAMDGLLFVVDGLTSVQPLIKREKNATTNPKTPA